MDFVVNNIGMLYVKCKKGSQLTYNAFDFISACGNSMHRFTYFLNSIKKMSSAKMSTVNVDCVDYI